MKIIKEANIAEHLWYKIGGTAQYLLVCQSQEDVVEAFEFIKREKVQKYFIAGLGSNLLFTDEYYDGAVIELIPNPIPEIKLIGKNIIEAFAGETLDSVLQFAFQNNLVGLEWAGGLPGTIGAAIRGNVGAFGGEIKDSFFSAQILKVGSGKPKIVKLDRRGVKFSYRSSTVKKNHGMIILSVQLKLDPVDDASLGSSKRTYFVNIDYRKNKHPMEYPSTGSSFKNISDSENVQKVLAVFPDIEPDVRIKWHGKISMGYLIKRLDLSGLQIGKAQISNKHSNFIINLGGAAYSDVINIINKVQETFQDTFGFIPEPEVEIVR